MTGDTLDAPTVVGLLGITRLPVLSYRIGYLATLCGKLRTVYRPHGAYLYNAKCRVQNAELWKGFPSRHTKRKGASL